MCLGLVLSAGSTAVTKMDKPSLRELTFKGIIIQTEEAEGHASRALLGSMLPPQIFLCALMKNNSVQIH